MLSQRINRMLPAISVLTHVSSDIAQPSLMLYAKDGKRYVLGRLGEGFQRNLVEHRTKSTKLSDIFISGPLTWDAVSGLPGYLLSLADVHKGGDLHCGNPERARSMIKSWKNFTVHNPLVGNIGDQCFQDNNVAIQAINVAPHAENSADQFNEASLPSTSYIIQVLPTRGKFLPAKAKQLGVPAGPLFGLLGNGQSVTTPEGKVVNPEDVVEPSLTPSRAVLLDLPTDGHIRSALELSWDRHLKRKSQNEAPYGVDVRTVYHFLGPNVDLAGPEFRKLVAMFGPRVEHIVSHKDYTPDNITLERLGNLQTTLNKVLPQNFSPLLSRGALKTIPESFADVDLKILQQGQVTALSPRDAPIKSQKSNKASVAEPPVAHQEKVEEHKERPLTEPEIITLGTGSSSPSRYRNVSGTLVRVPTADGVKSILFDCGEGSLNTLRRLFSPKDLEERLKELSIIYISHMHADHHLGVLAMIREWQRVNEGVLNLFGPDLMYSFIQEWVELDGTPDQLDRLNFVDLERIVIGKGYGPARSEDRGALYKQLGLVNAGACRAFHTDRSYCGFVEWKLISGETFKVAYSGDTRPQSFFAQVAHGSNLLIHEATHEDALAADAKAKRHSTVSEALGIGEAMGAKHIMLTHFSQRYPQLPTVGLQNFTAPTAFAFDGMRARISEIASLQEALFSLSKVFGEIQQEEEETTDETVDKAAFA